MPNQVSSTLEWKTKLGNVVVMSLFEWRILLSQSTPWTISPIWKHDNIWTTVEFQNATYLRYWRVMFFKSEGCCKTKFLHSSLSIFPSCLVSASSKVWRRRETLVKTEIHEKTSTIRIKTERWTRNKYDKQPDPFAYYIIQFWPKHNAKIWANPYHIAENSMPSLSPISVCVLQVIFHRYAPRRC